MAWLRAELIDDLRPSAEAEAEAEVRVQSARLKVPMAGGLRARCEAETVEDEVEGRTGWVTTELEGLEGRTEMWTVRKPEATRHEQSTGAASTQMQTRLTPPRTRIRTRTRIVWTRTIVTPLAQMGTPWQADQRCGSPGLWSFAAYC